MASASAHAPVTIDIVIAGVGGQGTVLASKLLAHAARGAGLPVRTAETIGMAQRGGSVLGHVRIGACESPLVPRSHATLLIGFEPAETVRALPYLRSGGMVVTAIHPIEPVHATLRDASYDGSAELSYLRRMRADRDDANWLESDTQACIDVSLRKTIGTLVEVDGNALCAALGSPRVLNVVLLGAACEALRHAQQTELASVACNAASLETALSELLKPQLVSLNVQALRLGAESVAAAATAQASHRESGPAERDPAERAPAERDPVESAPAEAGSATMDAQE